ncbi:MAG: FdhF/YdeP family oxidoreductase [Planctomycetes bacterium]|nr:FdhF/YdeP family oxidoreductase [Planctomycetota bacterium]
MKKLTAGGGFPAIRYAWKQARRSGGLWKFYRALRSRNTCKTCALGMGGQRGGMVDESGRFPEVCKKSMQAMAADMQGRIDPEFFERYSLEQLATFTPREMEHLGRLADPLYAGPEDTHYRVISWDEALAKCVEQYRRTKPEQSFFYVSGRSSNEAGFLLQLFARMYGTNNVNNCSYYCHQASGVGLNSVVGSGTATIVLEDVKHCDLLFVIGGNPASNHPRLMRLMMDLRRRGGTVIVINPMVETGLVRFKVPSDPWSLLFGSEIASHYIQPHIGGDLALLCGIAKRIDEMGAVNERFVETCTDGWPEFRGMIRQLGWSDIVAASGVEREQIDTLAEAYAASEHAIFAWTMGITHHRHGVQNVQAIANLALLRGMVGKPGAGLMPIRGHSNVQGIGSVGVAPALKKAFFERLESHFGVTLPTSEGLDTLACVQAMERGDMRTGWCLGGNLYGANPDHARARRSFLKLDFVVYLCTTLNPGHVLGRARETIVLPVLARDEEHQPTTQESMFSYVRLSDGAPKGGPRLDGPRSEVEIIAHIARGVLGDEGPIDWAEMETHRHIRQAIAKVVPGYEKVAAIDDTRQEFQIAGRTFHQPQFPTDTGRAKFHAFDMPLHQRDPKQLMLMTIRSEGQFNTVVYEEEDIYRHQERRDVILMNREDIEHLGLHIDQRVKVKSAVGEMKGIWVRAFEIRAGNAAMYYPEANALVPAEVDPQSRTPVFKAVPITIASELAMLQS